MAKRKQEPLLQFSKDFVAGPLAHALEPLGVKSTLLQGLDCTILIDEEESGERLVTMEFKDGSSYRDLERWPGRMTVRAAKGYLFPDYLHRTSHSRTYKVKGGKAGPWKFANENAVLDAIVEFIHNVRHIHKAQADKERAEAERERKEKAEREVSQKALEDVFGPFKRGRWEDEPRTLEFQVPMSLGDGNKRPPPAVVVRQQDNGKFDVELQDAFGLNAAQVQALIHKLGLDENDVV